MDPRRSGRRRAAGTRAGGPRRRPRPARARRTAARAPAPTRPRRRRGATRSAPWRRAAGRPSCSLTRELLQRADLTRSEEHTSELQSLAYLVCRLLLEKKKKIKKDNTDVYFHT